MTKQDTEQKSDFLIAQEKLMRARAEQDRSIQERQSHSLVPATNESQSRQTDIVETYIPQTGQSSRQVIEPTPQPTQRFVRPAPFSLPEIREQLVNAGNVIDSAKEQYQADVERLDAFYAEANALRIQIAELQAKIADKKERLTEIENEGTPKDKFLSTIVRSEQEVAGIAGALFTTLSEQASQKIFGIPFEELSADGKRDVQARFRKALQKFTGGFYVRLGRTAKTAMVEQIEKRSDELLSDVSDLIDSEYFSK